MAPVAGHHSYTGIDRTSVVAFSGTVTRFNWRNPHVYITVEASDGGNDVVEWEIETGGTPILARSGWTQDSLRPGDFVHVRGIHARRLWSFRELELQDSDRIEDRECRSVPIRVSAFEGRPEGKDPELAPHDGIVRVEVQFTVELDEGVWRR